MEHISISGANYFVSKQEVLPLKKTFAGIQPGTKLSQIGTKKRSAFYMQEGEYMTYEGIITHKKQKYAIFKTPAMKTPYLDEYYCYAFIIVGKSSKSNKLLIFTKTFAACRDVVIDKFKVFKSYTQLELF